MTFIATQCNPKEIEHLKNTFKALDKNGDGNLTLSELKEGLVDVKNGQEILDIMKAADTDNSGTINYTGKFLSFLMGSFIRIHCCYFGGLGLQPGGKLKERL